MNGHMDYRIASAMRGPDQVDALGQVACLKRHITARIRATQYSYNECLGLWRDRPLCADGMRFVEQALDKLDDNAKHFILHLTDAVELLKDHPVWGDYSEKLLTALRDWLMKRGIS